MGINHLQDDGFPTRVGVNRQITGSRLNRGWLPHAGGGEPDKLLVIPERVEGFPTRVGVNRMRR